MNLNSCPFCGSIELFDIEFNDWWHIECMSCGGQSGTYNSFELTAEAWNKRTSSHEEYMIRANDDGLRLISKEDK
jgi:hypothetical protein